MLAMTVLLRNCHIFLWLDPSLLRHTLGVRPATWSFAHLKPSTRVTAFLNSSPTRQSSDSDA